MLQILLAGARDLQPLLTCRLRYWFTTSITIFVLSQSLYNGEATAIGSQSKYADDDILLWYIAYGPSSSQRLWSLECRFQEILPSMKSLSGPARMLQLASRNLQTLFPQTLRQ